MSGKTGVDNQTPILPNIGKTQAFAESDQKPTRIRDSPVGSWKSLLKTRKSAIFVSTLKFLDFIISTN